MVIERDPTVKELVDLNNGYCPCAIYQNDDTLCPCKDFREMSEGVCACGRFEKIKE